MPHRTTSPSLLAAVLAAALSLAPGCASSSSAAGGAAPDVSDRPALPEGGVQVGWIGFKSAKREGQAMSLTLVSEGSREGKLVAMGKAVLPGGKVISDRDAADLLLTFEQSGFDRFAVRSNPQEGPQGALGAVWINRGNGIETLFLVPGARSNPDTHDLPDVYQGLKTLILGIHQHTPGSVATSGQGFAGDEILNQQPGKKVR